jgi:MinD-like ATPase involved in chromosome partitioning or flagellar assembly
MYVVTFYSFKGGVGRSMALVNVAAEIARRGKRVLVVDFDLEAPGLNTFDITKSDGHNRGLLDFVYDFRNTEEVPDVQEYVYQTGLELGKGGLWVMPAGLQDEQYHIRFRSIDWADLYSRQHGFLLFEDLKEQWKQVLGMDYVLIDSRTGHTDVGGICARQLPDAVVVFFFPNEQNRHGLSSIVSQIRAESRRPQRSVRNKIDVHFVMSNVPDLDDEEEILENEIKRFEQSLEFAAPSAIIHHYDSLALLEQVTFTVARPRSRLAREYAELTLAIIRKNIEDREGALEFLDQYRMREQTEASILDEKQLQEIRDDHAQDAEVLGKLAAARARQGKTEEALAIVTQALNTGTRTPLLLLRRAQLSSFLGLSDQVIEDLTEILESTAATGVELGRALRMLRTTKPEFVQLIFKSPALDRIEADTDFIRELEYKPQTLALAERLLTRWVANSKDEDELKVLSIELVLCLIGGGKYVDALKFFGPTKVSPENLDIPDIFNYAMALWGSEGTVPTSYFRRFVEFTSMYRVPPNPNQLQCFSLGNYLIGNLDLAYELLDEALRSNLARRASSFSCWSYLMVTVGRMQKDLEAMRDAYRSGQILPEYIRRNSEEIFDRSGMPG